jgi:tRNA(adenine34) deaminase
MQQREDEKWMKVALQQAKKAGRIREVPVGAVLVYENKIIARGHNLREKKQHPLSHAECIVIEKASKKLSSWRLENTTLYVTLEPCPMCAGAILQSRIPRIVYGAKDPKAGAVDSIYQLLRDPRLNHQAQVTSGIYEKECAELLKEFFQFLRTKSD